MPEAEAEALSGSSKSKTQSDLQSVNLKGWGYREDGFLHRGVKTVKTGGENGWR